MSNDPFELLLEMDRNAKAFALPIPSQRTVSEIWHGMGFFSADQHFVVDLHEIKEVIHLGNITALPISAAWFLGVCNLRGHILPVTDLQEFILNTPLKRTTLSKVLIIDFEKLSVGFLVEQVLGVQRFEKSNLKTFEPATISEVTNLDVRFIPYLQGIIQDDNVTWYVISLKVLSQTPQFYHIVKEAGG